MRANKEFSSSLFFAQTKQFHMKSNKILDAGLHASVSSVFAVAMAWNIIDEWAFCVRVSGMMNRLISELC